MRQCTHIADTPYSTYWSLQTLITRKRTLRKPFWFPWANFLLWRFYDFQAFQLRVKGQAKVGGCVRVITNWLDTIYKKLPWFRLQKLHAWSDRLNVSIDPIPFFGIKCVQYWFSRCLQWPMRFVIRNKVYLLCMIYIFNCI